MVFCSCDDRNTEDKLLEMSSYRDQGDENWHKTKNDGEHQLNQEDWLEVDSFVRENHL